MQDKNPDHAARQPAIPRADGAALRDHYANIVLPIWRGPGFNAKLGLAYEAVSPDDHAALPPSRYRAMACARQLFVFSLADDLAHAATLFASMRSRS
jgi:mannose-6-phosphate isomerase